MAAHFHKCPKCGKIWRHAPQNWPQAYIDRAHNCPECGHQTYNSNLSTAEQEQHKEMRLMHPEEHPSTPR